MQIKRNPGAWGEGGSYRGGITGWGGLWFFLRTFKPQETSQRPSAITYPSGMRSGRNQRKWAFRMQWSGVQRHHGDKMEQKPMWSPEPPPRARQPFPRPGGRAQSSWRWGSEHPLQPDAPASEARRRADSAKGQRVNDSGFPSQLSQLELLSAAWGAADDTYTQGHGHVPIKPCLKNKHWVDLIWASLFPKSWSKGALEGCSRNTWSCWLQDSGSSGKTMTSWRRPQWDSWGQLKEWLSRPLSEAKVNMEGWT